MLGVIVQNGELELADDLEVRPPEPHEVTVRVFASGLCRSDLIPLAEPAPDAMVLGHEAAGVVEEVGADVADVTVGQLVAVTCPVPCNRCDACARGLFTACATSFGFGHAPFTRQGEPVLALARVSSLAELITVDAFQVHPVANLDAPAASLIGCAVSTGYGMTRNVAKVRTGDAVIVFGVGGIGINSIQTAHLLGARRVVAVDVNPDKAAVASEFGATDFVAIAVGDSSEAITQKIQDAIGQKVDAVVDCTGQPAVLEASQRLLKAGGRLGLVGIPRSGTTVALDINAAMYNHIEIAGALNGACDPFVDIPDIVQLAEQGRLNLADQVSHRWPLAQYQEAIDALRAGDVLRVVIDMPAAADAERPAPQTLLN